MEEPLLSSAEAAGSASSSSSAKSSAQKPSDSCPGTFAFDTLSLLPRAPLLKLSVTGLSEMGNIEGAGGLCKASSISPVN